MSGTLHVQELLDAARRAPRPTGGPRRPARTAARLLGALAVLAACWGLGTWATQGRVPRGTTVAGVDLGGLDRADAVAALTRGLRRATTEPLAVAVAGRTARVDPVAAGLRLDAAATVDAAAGRPGTPLALWRALAGGGDVAPVTVVDAPAAAVALRSLARAVDVPPVEGSITFDGGHPAPHDPAPGRGLDAPAALRVLQRRWLTAPAPLALPAHRLRAAVGRAAVARAMTTTAVPATAGPVTVVSGAERVRLDTAVVAPALSMVPRHGRLELRVDGAALATAVTDADPAVVTAPTDARVDVPGDAPVVVPAVDGTRVDAGALAGRAVAALRGTDEAARTLTAPLLPVPAARSTAAVEALGITALLGEATTALTADPARTQDVQVAAAAVDGWLLAPGGDLDLAQALGTPSPQGGYTAAGVVHDGRLSNAFDAGVPQLAATLYDAALTAGLADAGHTAHATYDARYPEGREATVDLPATDLRIGDDTAHGVLVQAGVADGRLRVRLWGTPDADVAVTTGPRSAVVAAETVLDDDAGCVPVSPQDGFDVTVTRTWSSGGALLRSEDLRTSYAPRTGVVCAAPPAPGSPALLAAGD